MRLILLYLILSFTYTFDVAGQVIQLDEHTPFENIGRKVSYFKDESAALDIDAVKKLDKAGKFTQSDAEVLNFGNTKYAFWIKIRAVNKTVSKAYLVVDVPNIEHVDFYTNALNGTNVHIASGVLHKPVPGVRIANNITFALPNHSGTNTVQDIYLRVKSNNIILLPLKITASDGFTLEPILKDQLEYMYIGILFILFFFNMFLFLSFRDQTYLYYSLYVLSLFLYVVLYLRGYSYMFGDGFRLLLNEYPHVFLSFSLIVSILFCRKFLNLKKTIPGMIRYYNILIALSLVMLIINLLGHKSISAYFAQFNSFVSLIVVWFSGIVAYYRGHKPAKYFIFAWFFVSVSVAALILSLEGVLPTNDFTFEFVPACSTIELLLLSFALGDRYRVLIKNEQAVRDENLSLIQNQNQRLEELAEKRTEILKDTIAQLEASNAVKNKLFSIIAHDLRSPFNSLISIFSLKDMDLLTFEELKMLLNENRKNIETIHITLDNLLHWAKSQMEGIKTLPSAFLLNTIIEELMLIYSPLMQKKGIIAKMDIEGKFKVYADEDQVKLILRNLIDNAIKFTPKGHYVEIGLNQLSGSVKITVINQISETDKFDSKKILSRNTFETSYGTEQEKGIGLGLLLCREYAKSNGGSLDIEQIGKEVLFSFQLPKAP